MYLPTPNETTFELPPAGTHLAVCYRVIDLGTQQTEYMGQAKQQHKVLLSWELPDEKMADGRPFTMSQRYTWSMSEKATLRHHLEGWRGKAFSDADFGPNGFNIKNVLGKGCVLAVTHADKNGKRFANIASVGGLMRSMAAPPPPVNPVTYLWLHHDGWEPAVFHKLTQGLQETIMKSPEYAKLVNGYDEAPPVDAYDMSDEPVPF